MAPTSRTAWVVLTVTACGGGVDGGASKSADTSSGGVAGNMGSATAATAQGSTRNQTSGADVSAAAGSAVTLSVGSASQGGSPVATAGTASVAGAELVEVGIGTPCAPVGAKACAAADETAVVTCGNTGVWEVTSTCTDRQKCSSRNDSWLGTCRTMDCQGGSSEWHCIDQTLVREDEVRCSARGFVIARRKCLTNTCNNGVCDNSYVPSCDLAKDPNASLVTCRVGCSEPPSDACGNYYYALDGNIAAPILESEKYAYIHGSSDWDVVPSCPEVRKLIVQYVPLNTAIEVPAPYWVTFVESYQQDLCKSEARTRRCSFFDHDAISGGLAIVTTDPNAPAFVARLQWRGVRENGEDYCYPSPE